MPRVYEGELMAKDLKVAIVVGRFNEFIGSRLLEGAIDCFKRHGGDTESISLAWVPGAFEIPLVARRLAATNKFDAIICLGAVIRGATSHYDVVVNEVAKGVSAVSSQYDLPVLFGVLTTDTIEQAIERAGSKAGNKGWECALSAIEMANLLKKIPHT